MQPIESSLCNLFELVGSLHCPIRCPIHARFCHLIQRQSECHLEKMQLIELSLCDPEAAGLLYHPTRRPTHAPSGHLIQRQSECHLKRMQLNELGIHDELVGLFHCPT